MGTAKSLCYYFRMKASKIEFSLLCKPEGLPMPTREFKFHDTRKWRLDYAWPDKMVAMERDGLTYEGGRHQRMQGYEDDCEKLNTALTLGWKVLRVPPKHIDNGKVFEWLRELL